MRASVDDYVLTCPDYLQLKSCNTPKFGLLQGPSVPDRIWADTSVYFIVGPPEVKACDCSCVKVDRLSRYTHSTPSASSLAAEGVIRVFVNHMWKLRRFYRSIITDRDPQFVSALWRAFMTHLGTKKSDHRKPF